MIAELLLAVLFGSLAVLVIAIIWAIIWAIVGVMAWELIGLSFLKQVTNNTEVFMVVNQLKFGEIRTAIHVGVLKPQTGIWVLVYGSAACRPGGEPLANVAAIRGNGDPGSMKWITHEGTEEPLGSYNYWRPIREEHDEARELIAASSVTLEQVEPSAYQEGEGIHSSSR